LSEKFMYHCVDDASSPFIQQQCKKTNKHLEWMHRDPYYYFFCLLLALTIWEWEPYLNWNQSANPTASLIAFCSKTKYFQNGLLLHKTISIS
jgi:hypothetical protein